jgi:hypothetical protein
MLVVYRAGWARKVPDLVDFYEERKRHIVPEKLEPGVSDQVSDVSLLPGEQIVHAQDIVARLQKAIAKMRAQKS